MSATAKRQRGLAIHRSILIGNTATPLTEAERLHAPPDHTHKWTVAVRSAASHPLPTISQADQLGIPAEIGAGTPALANGEVSTPNNAAASSSGGAAAAAAGMSTRGRDSETDYHKMVGGKDDISHFIKRVQFKLHETYSQSQRNVDKPPFQVTETGWGEFDIQVKIYFVPEANEKPLTTFHRLKLHPWHPLTVPATSEMPATDEAQADVSLSGATTQVDGAPEDETHASMDQTEDVTTDINEVSEVNEVDRSMLDGDNENQTGAEVTVVKTEDASSGSAIVHETRSASAAAAMPVQRHMPAVVHSWSFDEIVFPEPLEPFYDILIANPPTPLPAQSAQAYADPSAFERYKESLQHLNSASGPQGRDINAESAIVRPHPLFDSTGAIFDALSREAILAEGERLDKARANAVTELEASRNKLIDCEARLRQGRSRITTATTVAPAKTTTTTMTTI